MRQINHSHTFDMMRFLSILILGLIVSPRLVAQQKSAEPSPAEQKLLDLLNQDRAIEKLPPLTWNAQAAVAARKHSRLLAEHKELSHQFEKEATALQRIAATGLRFIDSAENVAVADEPEDAHLALMLSAGHRANIMNPRYNVVGIGVFEDKGRLWITQDFAWATAVYSDVDFGTTLISTFNRTRRQKGFRPIDAHLDPRLNSLACSSKGEVRNVVSAISTNGGRVFLFTLSEPTQIPEQISGHLLSGEYQRVNVGVCYSPDEQHGYANFWVVTVFPA